MNNVVKNTTKCRLIDLLCPHSCRGCGHLGSILCGCCEKYLLERRSVICPLCKQTISKLSNNMLCSECETVFEGFWSAGWREGVLNRLIKDYKYRSVRAAGPVLAEILDEVLPSDLAEVVVVPLPTIGRHVRERGFDHTMVLARYLARRRGWKVKPLLNRNTDTVQVGAKVAQRQEQAKTTYAVTSKLEPEEGYLLLDDIWTTGASMKAAVEIMRQAGARHVMAAVVAISKPAE